MLTHRKPLNSPRSGGKLGPSLRQQYQTLTFHNFSGDYDDDGDGDDDDDGGGDDGGDDGEDGDIHASDDEVGQSHCIPLCR